MKTKIASITVILLTPMAIGCASWELDVTPTVPPKITSKVIASPPDIKKLIAKTQYTQRLQEILQHLVRDKKITQDVVDQILQKFSADEDDKAKAEAKTKAEVKAEVKAEAKAAKAKAKAK